MPVGMTAFLVRSRSVLPLILSDSGVCCGKVAGGEKTPTKPFYTSFLPSCRFFLPLQLPCRASDRPCHEFLRAAAMIFISLAIDKRFQVHPVAGLFGLIKPEIGMPAFLAIGSAGFFSNGFITASSCKLFFAVYCLSVLFSVYF